MGITLVVRISLAVSAPFNVLAGIAFAHPAGIPGVWLGLPTDTHALYSMFAGYMIGLFGIAYAWMAFQPSIAKPLLMFGAVGKLGAVAIVAALFMAAQVPLSLLLLIAPDILLALLWLFYLIREARRHDA